jgi:hypothetical protein
VIRAMSLAGLLPLLALALTVGLFRRRTGSMSEAIVPGALAWSFAIALGSEALSIWHAISLPYFLACWSLAVTGLALAVLWQGRAFPSQGRSGFPGMAGTPAGVAPHGRILLGRVRHALARPRLEDWILLAPLLVIGGATLLIAMVSPPNNWDSQTYHLPRIEHWIQNHSFDFYPTAIDRQLMLPGFAETLVLQLRLLSGGDRLDNMVQWLAGAGSVVVAGRIALALGASRRGAALARLTAATLPIGILESTSTQNDLVVTFFLMCTAERLLAWRLSRRKEDAAFMAVAIGLALATKGTAYLVGLPLGLWFLVEILPAGRRSALLLATCSLLLLLPNLPSYMKNLSYSRSPVGTIGRVSNNAEYGLGPLIVNGARNLAVNLATTDRELNQKITDAVYRGLAALGLDANAPALSFPPAPEIFRLVPYQTSEDVAGNPAQLLIGVASVLVVLFTRGTQPTRGGATPWRSLPPPLSSSSCSGGSPGSRACSCRYSLFRLPSPPSCRSTGRGVRCRGCCRRHWQPAWLCFWSILPGRPCGGIRSARLSSYRARAASGSNLAMGFFSRPAPICGCSTRRPWTMQCSTRIHRSAC